MKWKLLKTEPGYNGFFKVNLCHIQHETYEGGEIEVKRELLHRGDAVAVLLYDPSEDKVVLIEQFRVGAIEDENGPWMLEIIAGMVEQAETVIEVAKRECEEEAGVKVHNFEAVQSIYSSPGGCSERVHILCALVDSRQASGIHGLDHENEDIKVLVTDYEECLSLLTSGKICAASAVIALQWLQLNRERLQIESFVL